MTAEPTVSWDEPFEKLLRENVPLLPDGPLDAAADLWAHGLDSLASVRLLVDLETTYAITVPDELLSRNILGTPGELWDVVSSLIAQ
jgi:acyl carrier protein